MDQDQDAMQQSASKSVLLIFSQENIEKRNRRETRQRVASGIDRFRPKSLAKT
jgi:hypothetical protein